ncbi:MAG: hypothetical protein BHW62_07340 [Acinetobacter sp. CAG:196_36_41]|nr:MAG: hypothetical protein BHW62_07340 [Acinetobacter sp. CAG:196_36_41]
MDGGAISNQGNLETVSTDFISNQGRNGGALYLSSGTADIKEADILNNYASTYGGFLLSAYKDDFYAGWTINGGGLGVESKYGAGKDDYAIVTADTALKLAYNWKIFKRFILQPNFTTAYTFLSPSNLVNYQEVSIDQSQVNGLTIAPSLRLTYRNEEGFEPYVYGGCVIPLMSDVKAYAGDSELDKMTLNSWAQFEAGNVLTSVLFALLKLLYVLVEEMDGD